MSLISRLIVQRMLLNSKWGVGGGRAATNQQWTDRQLENTPFLSGVLGNYPVNAIILRNETLSTDNEMFVQKRLSRCRPVIGWRGVRLGCRLIPRVVRWYVNRPSTLFHELEMQDEHSWPRFAVFGEHFLRARFFPGNWTRCCFSFSHSLRLIFFIIIIIIISLSCF